MTRCVAFRTPGLIPIESFTTFGVNAKPMSTSPFGYFGTGLKYAIAVLLRNGCRVVMWRGSQSYEFYVKREDFRGKEFAFVRMKSRHVFGTFMYHKLPFTTELGKNWELWQAFRELETNTRDEGGDSFVGEFPEKYQGPLLEQTVIQVYGDKFTDEFLDMDRHFLPEGKIMREDEAVQVIARPSKHIYYRGVRVMDLKQEAEFTYNILSTIELTEDRTVKYSYAVEQIIAKYIITNDDDEFVDKVSQTRRWESSGLNYGYAYAAPSAAFRRSGRTSTNATARKYLEDHDPSVATTTTIQISVPRPEVTENELADVCRVVAETLGIKDIRVTNMHTQDHVDASEVLF